MKHRFRNSDHDEIPVEPDSGGDVVEMPLLLPGWQVTALEMEAHGRGLTAAEMVRHLLRDFIERLPMPPPDTLLVGSSKGGHY